MGGKKCTLKRRKRTHKKMSRRERRHNKIVHKRSNKKTNRKNTNRNRLHHKNILTKKRKNKKYGGFWPWKAKDTYVMKVIKYLLELSKENPAEVINFNFAGEKQLEIRNLESGVPGQIEICKKISLIINYSFDLPAIKLRATGWLSGEDRIYLNPFSLCIIKTIFHIEGGTHHYEITKDKKPMFTPGSNSLTIKNAILKDFSAKPTEKLVGIDIGNLDKTFKTGLTSKFFNEIYYERPSFTVARTTPVIRDMIEGKKNEIYDHFQTLANDRDLMNPVSRIDNLPFIFSGGLRKFLKDENKWGTPIGEGAHGKVYQVPSTVDNETVYIEGCGHMPLVIKEVGFPTPNTIYEEEHFESRLNNIKKDIIDEGVMGYVTFADGVNNKDNISKFRDFYRLNNFPIIAFPLFIVLKDNKVIFIMRKSGDKLSAAWPGQGKRETEKITPHDTLQILYDVASGLNYMHTFNTKRDDTKCTGIFHRDIKSSNICIETHESNKRGCIIDLGEGRKILDDAEDAEISGEKRCGGGDGVGSVLWMAPEILLGDSYTEKVDIFSFGMVMYEFLMGSIPWGCDKVRPEAIPNKVALGSRPTTDYGDSAWPLRRGDRRRAEKDPFLKSFKELMKECWQQKADHRPSAEEIMRRLLSINESIDKTTRREIITMKYTSPETDQNMDHYLAQVNNNIKGKLEFKIGDTIVASRSADKEWIGYVKGEGEGVGPVNKRLFNPYLDTGTQNNGMKNKIVHKLFCLYLSSGEERYKQNKSLKIYNIDSDSGRDKDYIDRMLVMFCWKVYDVGGSFYNHIFQKALKYLEGDCMNRIEPPIGGIYKVLRETNVIDYDGFINRDAGDFYDQVMRAKLLGEDPYTIVEVIYERFLTVNNGKEFQTSDKFVDIWTDFFKDYFCVDGGVKIVDMGIYRVKRYRLNKLITKAPETIETDTIIESLKKETINDLSQALENRRKYKRFLESVIKEMNDQQTTEGEDKSGRIFNEGGVIIIKKIVTKSIYTGETITLGYATNAHGVKGWIKLGDNRDGNIINNCCLRIQESDGFGKQESDGFGKQESDGFGKQESDGFGIGDTVIAKTDQGKKTAKILESADNGAQKIKFLDGRYKPVDWPIKDLESGFGIGDTVVARTPRGKQTAKILEPTVKGKQKIKFWDGFLYHNGSEPKNWPIEGLESGFGIGDTVIARGRWGIKTAEILEPTVNGKQKIIFLDGGSEDWLIKDLYSGFRIGETVIAKTTQGKETAEILEPTVNGEQKIRFLDGSEDDWPLNSLEAK